MSRIDQYSSTEVIVEHDNKIRDIINTEAEKEDRVIICDFDSLIHEAAYAGKDEEGKLKPDYTVEEYEIAEGVLSDNILKVLNKIEEYFNVSALYICIKGKNNFRRKLYPEYKSKRPPSLPIIGHLCNYMVEKYDALRAEGCEADDCLYSISSTINHQGIIVSQDHDMDQIPNTIIYNYRKDIWKRTTEKSAKWALALSLCTGCSGDGIPGLIGIGPKKAEKIIHPEMTDREYIAAIWKAYKKFYGTEASQKIRMMYNLLKLHDMNNLPKI